MIRTNISYLAAIQIFAVSLLGHSCHAQPAPVATFQDAVALVNEHSHLIVLSDDAGRASIAVWPAMQGRVLTSTATGAAGHSFGWVNRELIASGKNQPHMNTVGGEDRLWLGPEGGQFSIFFAPGVPFDLDHWYTPAPIDTEPFDIVRQAKTSVSFRKDFGVINYSGTKFQVRVDREVRLLSSGEVWKALGVSPVQGIKLVGFESNNTLTNVAATSWSKSTGLLSIWILGQFEATPTTTIILPIHPGPTERLGIPVTTDYFGTVPADRIAIEDNAVFFKADANYRSKLGLSPLRGKGVLGSYDRKNRVLTVVQYTQPPTATEYVNSSWKIQDNPFKGDVANCYNDGPPAPGKPQLGHFYEMESSSPAETLAPNASVKHTQRTIHLVGPEDLLDPIAKKVLGVSLEDVHLSGD
jgi:hypothetical protein